MRILECGDATEVESVLDVAEKIDGPVYIRILRGEVPRLFPKTEPMEFGVVRVLSEGTDVAVVTAGICTEEAVRVSKSLKSMGVGIKHLHLSTLVPFPAEVVVAAARSVEYGMITMENHSIIGGVGSAAAEALAEAGVSKRLVRLGVPGVYAHGASRPYLMAEYGLDANALIRAIEGLLGKSLGLDQDSAFELDPSTKPMAPENQGLSVEERPEDL
jgi:transketolase